jgi:hypothetical protein
MFSSASWLETVEVDGSLDLAGLVCRWMKAKAKFDMYFIVRSF